MKVSLLAKAQSGLLWNGGFRLLQITVQFCLTLVLVRLLAPEDYGIYAVTAGIIGFLNVISFDNFIAYILQVRNDDDVHAQDHFTAGIVIQIFIFFVSNLVALALRYVPSHAYVSQYIHVLSPILLLSAIGGFRYRLLERDLRWRRYRLLQVIGILLTAITMLGLAFSGAGVYGLLIAPSINYLPPIVDLFFVERWRPTWQWSYANYKPAMQFGLNRVTSSGLVKGRAMVEANGLVALADIRSLGFYNRSIGLMQMICVQLASIVVQSVYPVLTKVEPGSVQYRKASALVLRGIAWVIIPVSAVGAIHAVPVVRLLFGEKWLPVAALLPMSLALGSIAAVGQAAYHLALASLQESKCVWLDALHLIGMIASFACWPLHHSVEGYLLGLVIVEAAILSVSLWWLHEAHAVSVDGLKTAFFPPLVASVIGYGIVFTCFGHHPAASLLSVTNVAIGLFFLASYVVVLRLAFRNSLDELVSRMPYSHRLRQLLIYHS